MMMYIQFDDKKLEENAYSKQDCYQAIDAFLNAEGIYAKEQGIYIADEDIGFLPFAKLRAYLPKTKWFMQVVRQWYWFDDEKHIDFNDDGSNCLKKLNKKS